MSPSVILAFASFLCAGLLAFGVAWHERRSVAHWSFAAGMAALAMESLFLGLSADAVVLDSAAHYQILGMVAMSFLPGAWLIFSLTYARGNYREFLVRWRVILAAALLIPVAVAAGFSAKLISAIGNPGSKEHLVFRLGSAGLALHLLFLLSAVLVLMNLERTFRASVGTMRWRIKFMVLGLGVLFAVRAYTSSQVLLFRAADPSLQAVNAGALLLACLLVFRTLFRTGHFEVGIHPSHSLLQHSLTVSLAGVYLLIVGVFAKVVAAVGGEGSFPLKAFFVLVSLVLLAILLLSERVRLHTRRFISRHLQRPLHDYRTVWKTFTEGTASYVEPPELCRAMVKLVSDLFQVLSVTVWLADDKQESLTVAASTSLSPARGGALGPQGNEGAELIRALRDHADPVDIDSSKEPWAAVLRRCHPGEFRKGGNRFCVPMLAGGSVLGFMTVGDRVGGIPFSLQDFDLLKCVADQAAASLLNIQLAQRLMQAKELEAFQTMSAFFVHDLKNTASTLSLMLKNLPVHFDNPAFREDALRAVSKTVDHINGLIGRLSLLRDNLAIKPARTDLNELVASALKPFEATAGVTFEKALEPLPSLWVDAEQVRNVITNLLLNAREALGQGGTIRVATSRQDPWAVLAVTDNGCGMSPEFVSRSLFRPFQTTKKQGIGVGMFQCKMIIEAHRGKIRVESEPGRGTTFEVMLPLQHEDK